MLDLPRGRREIPGDGPWPHPGHPEGRQSISRRADCGPQLASPGDAAGGTGRPGEGSNRDLWPRVRGHDQSVARVLAFLALAVSLACHREAADPQAVFDRIQLDLRHAKLAKAQAEAHQEFVRFSDEDPAWAWKFRLLEAEVAAYRGLNQEALSTLTPELPSPLTTSDLAVKQRLLRALVLSTMGRPEPANRDLELAEQLCRTSQCSLAGQLARVGGVVEFSQNHVEKAELYFLDSLRFARRQQDRFLESAALLNMSAVALAREHFDEAIDWAERAQRLAKDVGSYLDEEKAVGNLGWAHYKMGDFELSSEYFAKAAQMAHDLGVVKDETIWLNNSGLVYFRTGELELARKYYLQSFDLARKTQNSERILDSL